MSPPFDPAGHPTLAEVGARLRELAGDSAYAAGRSYLQKGLVKQGAVAATTAYATVTGSTDYRVSVAFADEPKVTCTCPAHRRSRYCKHVVAVCVALLERPADFAFSAVAPPTPPTATKRTRAGGARPVARKPQVAEQRAAGLEMLDRLIVELADDGLMSLGPDKAALLSRAGELVRALKLRRLGNLLLALQRAAESASSAPGSASTSSPRARGVTPLEPRSFAELLVDLYLARRTVGSQLEGRISLDPRLAEDLLGKTWRDEDLEPVGGLELMEIGCTQHDDGKFRIESSHLADLSSGTLFAETTITPLRMARTPKARHRQRLLVDEAGLYPGVAPRRIKLRRVRREVLTWSDVQRLLARAPATVPELRRRLVERLQTPFASTEVPTLFRPSALLARDGQIAAVDREGGCVLLDWPAGWTAELRDRLVGSGEFALFGLVRLGERGMQLRGITVLGADLGRGSGPIYPDG